MKKYIIGFILGLIVATTIGVSATVLYQADEVGFTPSNPNWNVNNLEDALNDLYTNNKGISPELLWTNPNPTSPFTAQTISMDLSDYKYLIIIVNDTNGGSDHSTGIVPVGANIPDVGIARVGGAGAVRHFNATSSSIIIGRGQFGSSTDNNSCIPYKIYGVAGDIDIDLGLE